MDEAVPVMLSGGREAARRENNPNQQGQQIGMPVLAAKQMMKLANREKKKKRKKTKRRKGRKKYQGRGGTKGVEGFKRGDGGDGRRGKEVLRLGRCGVNEEEEESPEGGEWLGRGLKGLLEGGEGYPCVPGEEKILEKGIVKR